MMQIKGMNLCDLCFAPVESGNLCEKCKTLHGNYRAKAGTLSPGTVLIGKYIVGKSLGRGGFGATYVAYSNDLGKPVAIKEYLPVTISYRETGSETVSLISEDKREVFEKGAAKFFEEAKTISRFNGSDNIVNVYEFFHANNTVYYSMELLDGVDLKKYINLCRGKLSEYEVINILGHLCNALNTIHSTGTLHRDISPDNVFICYDGRIKLIDFGSAKQVVGDESNSFSVVLKQGFAPTEQYARKGNQGPWTDIYSLGATAYYALTGKVPCDAFDREDNPYLEMGEISNDMVAVLNKCLQVKPEMRYQSVSQLFEDIERLNVLYKPFVMRPHVLQQQQGTVKADYPQAKTTAADNIQTQKQFAAQEKSNSATGQKKDYTKPLIIGLISCTSILMVLVIAFAFVFVGEKNSNKFSYHYSVVTDVPEQSESEENIGETNETQATEESSNTEKTKESTKEESKPESNKETKPEETKPKETKPKETKPEETKPKETKPAETKPEETKPEAEASSWDGDDSIADKYDELANADVGDYIKFGSYEQDNNLNNGKEEIEWLVLDKEGDRILVISRYGLDCQPYNEEREDVTWETCTLRRWLNNEFLYSAFSSEERAMIPTIKVEAHKNPNYNTDPGNNTNDKVFLLSITEANEYFDSNKDRICKPTAYAVANGVRERDEGNCWWWLRSPGFGQRFAAIVDCGGDVSEHGLAVYYAYSAVRPTLWVNLES